MSVVVEGCELTQMFKKFDNLERRVTYLEEKCRGQEEVIEELQTKSRSQQNIIHELQSELKKKTATKNLVGQSSEEEFEESVEVDVNPHLNEPTGPIQIQNTQIIVSEKDDKLSQSLVAHMDGAIYSEKPQRLENTCENSAEVETDPESKMSQYSAHQKVKPVEKSSKPKRKWKKSYICVYCSKSCRCLAELTEHLRIHTGERPYECKICLKSFSSRSNFNTHTGLHTSEKPFSCSVCSKSFADNSTLKMHMRIHSDEKPFHCSVCSKKLGDKSSLQKHMRIHSGEKPYSCSVTFCPMTFSRTSSLNYHMNKKHFGTFSCSICSKRFGQKYFLKIHERVHTRERPINGEGEIDSKRV